MSSALTLTCLTASFLVQAATSQASNSVFSSKTTFLWRSRSKSAPTLPRFAKAVIGRAGVPEICKYVVSLAKAKKIRNVVALTSDVSSTGFNRCSFSLCGK